MATRLLFAVPRSPYNRIGDSLRSPRRVRAGRAALRSARAAALGAAGAVHAPIFSPEQPALSPRCARSPWAVRAGSREMIVGIGVDVVEVSRFRRQLQRTPALRERLFTPAERELKHAGRWPPASPPRKRSPRRWALPRA